MEVYMINFKHMHIGLRRLGRICLLLLFCMCIFTGCTWYQVKEDGEELTYDICDDTMLPEELLTVINSKKEEAFNLTYSNNTYTYIVICSGRQDRDDVGVEIEKMYMDENAIYVESVLKQISTSGDVGNADTGNTDAGNVDTVTWPYTVIRINKTTMPVIFMT
jgi:hypothetical protein